MRRQIITSIKKTGNRYQKIIPSSTNRFILSPNLIKRFCHVQRKVYDEYITKQNVLNDRILKIYDKYNGRDCIVQLMPTFGLFLFLLTLLIGLISMPKKYR